MTFFSLKNFRDSPKIINFYSNYTATNNRHHYTMPRKARIDAPGALHHIIERSGVTCPVTFHENDKVIRIAGKLMASLHHLTNNYNIIIN